MEKPAPYGWCAACTEPLVNEDDAFCPKCAAEAIDNKDLKELISNINQVVIKSDLEKKVNEALKLADKSDCDDEYKQLIKMFDAINNLKMFK